MRTKIVGKNFDDNLTALTARIDQNCLMYALLAKHELIADTIRMASDLSPISERVWCQLDDKPNTQQINCYQLLRWHFYC